jgi:hypothetical protein
MDEINGLPHCNKIDAEAEACALACEMIVNRFNGDERSFDHIKAEYIDKLK